MGRQQRKEDRQARKKTKISATQSHAKNASGSANSVGKQATNAGFVFNKNQFSSLVNKGKARQLQQMQQQQAALQKRSAAAAAAAAMEMDPPTLDAAEGSAAAAARLRDEIADAAATSNGIDNSSTESNDNDDAETFFASAVSQLDPTLTGKRDSSIKAYMRELRKVIDNADVLLQVLDARDPLGCRSLETERMLLRAGKKIVLILNKIDLVPKSNVEAWLRYLRHDFPTLAFKASTQSQRTNLSQGANADNYSKPTAAAGGDVIAGGSEAIGAGALLQLIKNYSRSLNLKTSIAVGVFGAPNVGKSSLINSLKRARVCSVASTPGHTKVVQSVMLDKSVRLLDCPGIVFSDESAAGAAALGLSADEIQMRRQSALLRNVVKVELVEDPITPVEAIMARVEPDHLMQVYGLEWFQEGDAQDLLMRIAVQRGRMARGGKIDIDGTARSVLHDWNVGRIKYYTHPPALHRSAILTDDPAQSSATDALAKSIGGVEGKDKKLEQSSAILSGFSEAFDLAGLLGEADAEVFGAGTGQSSLPLPEAPAPRYAHEEQEQEQQQEEIQDDHEPVVAEPTAEEADTSRRSTLGKRSRMASASDESGDDSDDDAGAFASRRRTVGVPGLDPPSDDDDDDDDTAPTPTLPANTTDATTNAWTDKLAAKATSASSTSKRTAELSLAFSAEELAQMAPSAGASRRKLKKLKKRADRAGAGLVGQFQEHKLGESEAVAQGNGRGIGGGMFGDVRVNGGKKEVKRKGTGSMFDVLLEGQDMASDEEENGVDDDFEEEL
ncbi:related to NUG1-Nuclear GTPase (involved in Ribosome biogenesis) [Sporisorium reilianum SRZ2]|uniref:Related to NUG1-Nuclear GTPase (Involved in Ribosome biogenesis) n=1 Tax=Sporisorium reilianum (strain SRZ2) TaxID=999809 RepID=E6ZYK0_SPORE|nr:related to NUG1-Nuclear GTPase (involved in Ribosome biogenesis) [Sporisorium reilianum SRZ2]